MNKSIEMHQVCKSKSLKMVGKTTQLKNAKRSLNQRRMMSKIAKHTSEWPSSCLKTRSILNRCKCLRKANKFSVQQKKKLVQLTSNICNPGHSTIWLNVYTDKRMSAMPKSTKRLNTSKKQSNSTYRIGFSCFRFICWKVSFTTSPRNTILLSRVLKQLWPIMKNKKAKRVKLTANLEMCSFDTVGHWLGARKTSIKEFNSCYRRTWTCKITSI